MTHLSVEVTKVFELQNVSNTWSKVDAQETSSIRPELSQCIILGNPLEALSAQPPKEHSRLNGETTHVHQLALYHLLLRHSSSIIDFFFKEG